MNISVRLRNVNELLELLDLLEELGFDYGKISRYRAGAFMFMFESNIEILEGRYFEWGYTEINYTLDEIKVKPKNFLLTCM